MHEAVNATALFKHTTTMAHQFKKAGGMLCKTRLAKRVLHRFFVDLTPLRLALAMHVKREMRNHITVRARILGEILDGIAGAVLGLEQRFNG